MAYLVDLKTHWRPVLAATIGMGTGYSLTSSYVMSVQAPYMIADFGWDRASFALVSSLSIIMSLIFPFVGRLTDSLGVRRTAAIGMVALPIAYVGLSLMTGDLRQYVGLFLFQTLFAVTTTATVYSRLPVQYVTQARGLALAIVASGPAAVSAVGAPLLNHLSASHGWRTGWLALAAFSVVSSIVVLLLLPRERQPVEQTPRPKPRLRDDYPAILRERAFWVLFGAMLLCNLPQVLAMSQLALVLHDNGVEDVSIMLSAFAIGTLAGRFGAGVALDHFSPRIVAATAMALPSLGLVLIASSLDSPAVLTFAVLCFGLSLGAEGDLVGYLVSRTFPVRIFSSVLGLMTMAIAFSAASGAAILALVLRMTGRFDMFLIGAAAAVLAGSLLFLLLPPTAKEMPA